jgi:hypothetical protein
MEADKNSYLKSCLQAVTNTRKCVKCGSWFNGDHEYGIGSDKKICKSCEIQTEQKNWEGSREQRKRILEVYGKNKKGLMVALKKWEKESQ